MLKGFCEGKVFAHIEGEGELSVVMMHGWGRSSQDFAPTVAEMIGEAGSERLKTVRVDLPGFGSSPVPGSALSTSEYADLIAEMIDELFGGRGEDEKVLIVGHSFGGRVALSLAAKKMPERVGHMVLVGTPLIRDVKKARVSPSVKVARKLHSLGLLSDAKMEKMRQRYGSEDYRNASGVMREILVRSVNESYEELFPIIKCPTTLLFGERDGVTSVAQAKVAQGLMPDAKVVTVPDVGHLLPVEAPKVLAEIVLDKAASLLRTGL
ncbi:Pimeloyl-ACP methyl ester carboxylesterase [Ferrithrix thermotolerans DSM 19514]|uniref:Pimeloyl-ACP methyl ester carboxylesterase n=1 Tax=Ferrithrix thermotolerans DSM 19514 TaxID=1121881 RepID=A0A1M4S5R9_9ACTN|nr:alpha/beta hydrolase [Ferrithrix thermotolerans]SHE27367.1 Pimeloyl-ACP methyl ester carboxylesterase [Ferrithrix thermotolerans DSM 19514]